MVIVYKNARVVTMDEALPEATSFAVSGGRFVAVGTADEVERFASEAERRAGEVVEARDLGGACVVPGFIDAHMHPIPYIFFKTQLDLSGIRDHAALRRILAREDARLPPGRWIVGVDLMEDLFTNPEERHFPTRRDLDAACPRRPVVVIRHDGHILAANTPVVEKVGVDASNVVELTPEGGEIKVDAGGEPNGIFVENAKELVYDELEVDLSSFKEAAREFSGELASMGITTCGGIVQTGEKGYSGKLGAFELSIFQVLVKEGFFEQDFVLYFVVDRIRQLKRIQRSFARLDPSGDRFVVGGVKLFADGTFGASTALMFEPYSDASDGNTGYLVESEEDLYNWTREAYDAGYQVATHCIGDRGNQFVVDLYGRVIRDSGVERPGLLRIEHASMLRRDVLEKAARLGITLVTQPPFINSEYTWLESRLGVRVEYTYNYRDIFDAGCLLAGASDAPVEPASVLEGIRACVTRNGFVPEQRITVEEALRMYTLNAARALGQGALKGSVTPGKYADFVVLDGDPREVPPDDISSIGVLETYHRGRRIFSATGRDDQ
ncbi:MAG: amidohydrolase [Promethearchaeota archaeon]